MVGPLDYSERQDQYKELDLLEGAHSRRSGARKSSADPFARADFLLHHPHAHTPCSATNLSRSSTPYHSCPVSPTKNRKTTLGSSGCLFSSRRRIRVKAYRVLSRRRAQSLCAAHKNAACIPANFLAARRTEEPLDIIRCERCVDRGPMEEQVTVTPATGVFVSPI